MTTLRGLLVDLVPLNKVYRDREHVWRNHEASFWSSGGDRPIASRAQVARMYEGWLDGKERSAALGVTFGVQTKDGTPIGFCSLNWVVPFSRLAMLGARIGEPEYWGGGYGTDALTLIVDYTFEWLDARRIWLMTTSMNARVIRQMEKVGFTLEGRQREGSWADGRWVDWMAYGLLREEWPGRERMVERLRLRDRVSTPSPER